MRFATASFLILILFSLSAFAQCNDVHLGSVGQVKFDEWATGAGKTLRYCDTNNKWVDLSTPTKASLAAASTCTSGALGKLGLVGGTLSYCDGTNQIYVRGNLTTPGPSCSPSGLLNFDFGTGIFRYCNGSGDWVTTSPSRHGFFVLTQQTYSGNLGGFAGAKQKCISELRDNIWNGRKYVAPIADNDPRIRAFLCINSDCQSPQPNKRYYFAIVGNSTTGGESFIANGSGQGPANDFPWNGQDFFGAGFSYWTGRANPDNNTSLWAVTGPIENCGGWTSTVGLGVVGSSGSMVDKFYRRWNTGTDGSCSSTTQYRLICMVDP